MLISLFFCMLYENKDLKTIEMAYFTTLIEKNYAISCRFDIIILNLHAKS